MPHSPDSTDHKIGEQIRIRRTLLGMSLERLGELTGINFRLLNEYERGKRSLYVSYLKKIAAALQMSPSFFLKEEQTGAKTAALLHHVAEGLGLSPETLIDQHSLEIIGAYHRISDPHLKAHLRGSILAAGGLAPGQRKRGRPRITPTLRLVRRTA